MSSFFIGNSAFMTRRDFSGSLNNWGSTVGTIRHDIPNLSLSQPHWTSRLPPTIFPVGVHFILRLAVHHE